MSAGADVVAAGVVVVAVDVDGVCASAAVANNADPTNAVVMYFANMCAPPVEIVSEQQRMAASVPASRRNVAASSAPQGCAIGTPALSADVRQRPRESDQTRSDRTCVESDSPRIVLRKHQSRMIFPESRFLHFGIIR
jgi:hypothetical protein